MSHISREDWKPQGVNNLEDNALKALRENSHSVLVTAGAGAGKTEFLAQKANYLLQTCICPAPKRILAISFKKDAARNLAERVAKRCPNQAHRFDSMTFDAFTKGFWDRFRSALPEYYNSHRVYKIVMPSSSDYDDFLRRHGFHNLRTQDFERQISITDLPINLSANPDIICRALNKYWEEMFINKVEILLSFQMINRLVKLIFQRNPYICRALQITYPFVFIDEFQDTTYAQYNLLLTAFAGSKTVFTAVGDDKQRIMGWAGAMQDAFTRFETDFAAKRVSLCINWRSHEGLVRIQQKIANIIDNGAEIIQPRGARAIEGTVSAIWMFHNPELESNYLSRWICREIQLKHIKPHDIAILVRMRANRVESEISHAFAKNNVMIRNLDRQVGEIKIQDLLAEDMTRILIPLLRLGAMERCPKCWEFAQRNQQIMESVDLLNERMLCRLQTELERFINKLKYELNLRQPNQQSAEEIVNMLFKFVTPASLQQTFPAYRRKEDFERVRTGFVTLLNECADHNNTWEAALNEFEGIGQVALMTVHKSKGLEFHTIIFYGLDKNSWWSLTPSNPEELNTFFVAFTRAKQRAFFSRCEAKGDSIGWIEQILNESGVSNIDGTTILNFV